MTTKNNSTKTDTPSESATAACSPPKKRKTVFVDGKKTTMSEEKSIDAKYGMGEWWFKEGQFL